MEQYCSIRVCGYRTAFDRASSSRHSVVLLTTLRIGSLMTHEFSSDVTARTSVENSAAIRVPWISPRGGIGPLEAGASTEVPWNFGNRSCSRPFSSGPGCYRNEPDHIDPGAADYFARPTEAGSSCGQTTKEGMA